MYFLTVIEAEYYQEEEIRVQTVFAAYAVNRTAEYDVRSEGRMKKIAIIVTVTVTAILVLPFAIYIGFLFLVHDCNPDFLKIDSCLDAGGKWDYENRVCIFSEDLLTNQEDETGSNQ